MILEIWDGMEDAKCLIKADGERVKDCIGYEIKRDASHKAPKVVLILSPEKVIFKGRTEDVSERKDI